MSRWAIWMRGEGAELRAGQLDDLFRVLQPQGGWVSRQERFFNIVLSLSAEDRDAAAEAALAFWQEHLRSGPPQGLLIVPSQSVVKEHGAVRAERGDTGPAAPAHDSWTRVEGSGTLDDRLGGEGSENP
jgi:hypothetical protein